MRVEAALLLFGATACLHRPSDERAEQNERLRQLNHPEIVTDWRPPAAERRLDALGAPTSSDAFDLSFLAGLDEAEEEEAVEVDEVVAPILAWTGTGTVTFDIPMSDDERVDQWIEYLTTKGRRWFGIWLSRSTRMVPIFWRILDEYDLPRDLVFLSMIESGFSTRAYSWAHAAGPWQFMPATGRQYGLTVGFWIDERRDFELSTRAAARYLTRLHDYYDGDWYLAWSAYNGGVRRINRAIRALGTRDYWRLSRTWHLRRETRHYVPKLLAAARIAKEPEKYGFEDVPYQPQMDWEVMTVTVATDLETIARACEVEDVKRLVTLNSALRTEVTPPGLDYPVRVPAGTATRCEENLRGMEDRKTYRYYEVKGDRSLQQVAEAFKTTPEEILAFNDIIEAQFFDFEELVVPLPLSVAQDVPIRVPPKKKFRPNRYGPEGARLIVYEVKAGDSLWRVARRFRVSMKKLRLWNGLWKTSKLRVGQKLKLYVGRGRAPSHPRWRRKT